MSRENEIFFVKVNQDLGALATVLKAVPGGMVRASVRALNTTTRRGKTAAAGLLRNDLGYAVKAKDITACMTASLATPNHLYSVLTARGAGSVSLYEFAGAPKLVAGTGGATATRRTKAGGYTPKVGASALIDRAKGRHTYPRTFVARVWGDKVGIFVRTGNKLPSPMGKNKHTEALRRLSGPSPVILLKSEKIGAKLRQLLAERLETNMLHEVKFELSKVGVK